MAERRSRRSWMFCVAVLAASGCGVGPEKVSAPDAAETAFETQVAVDAFVGEAKKGKGSAAETAILLESLEARASVNGGAYNDLRDSAQQLKTMYEQKKPKAEIEAQLDKLKQQAAAL